MEALHPRVRILWVGYGVLVGVVAGLAAVGIDRLLADVSTAVQTTAVVVVGLLGVLYAIRRYQVWQFELQDDALYLERGVITFVETAVPFVRVQHVDTQFGPVERALGLASVVVYTAGSRNADVRVPGLRPSRARELQDSLRELAVASDTDDAV